MNRVLVNLYDRLDSLRIIDIHLFEGKRSIVQKNNINMKQVKPVKFKLKIDSKGGLHVKFN